MTAMDNLSKMQKIFEGNAAKFNKEASNGEITDPRVERDADWRFRISQSLEQQTPLPNISRNNKKSRI